MKKDSSNRDELGSSLIDTISEGAQHALKARPTISIRTRLSLGFFVWFILSIGITLVSIIIIARIQDKLFFMEALQSYTFEIQQARRFEKNYFLYGTNFEDTLEHVRNAKKILQNEKSNLQSVIGPDDIKSMQKHLVRYEELLMEVRDIDKEGGPGSDKYKTVESRIRDHGGEMLTAAGTVLATERASINRMLATSKKIPVIFLAVLLCLIIYLTIFIARQMLAPLNRMMQATRRISKGDFTPITPKRRYHDEFSELAVAMNRMMVQLVQRHDMLLQAHKLKAVGTLTAGIAHELNNPINNIILTSSAMQEEYKDLDEDELDEMIGDLIGESERAQKIVRNLLDFAREREMETEPLDIERIIAETLQLASNQIKFAKVKVSGEIESDLPHVFGDRQQLTQVFLNIILNAIDAMAQGGSIKISVESTKDREYVAVDFTDTGAGIPPQILSEIFDPFFTTKKKGKGTGLGLSVSLGIIQKHGGDIKARSAMGKGTTMTVLLPVARVPAEIPDKSS